VSSQPSLVNRCTAIDTDLKLPVLITLLHDPEKVYTMGTDLKLPVLITLFHDPRKVYTIATNLKLPVRGLCLGVVHGVITRKLARVEHHIAPAGASRQAPGKLQAKVVGQMGVTH
jgi:hypothetical protein